jgi:hypothetical protein
MGTLSSTGSHAVVDNGLTLHVVDVSRNSFGYFLTSRTPGYFPNAGGSVGILCLASPIGRFVGPGQIQHSGQLGAASVTIDLTRHPTPTVLVAVQPGETWYYTYWFRQTDVGGVASSNFADRLAVSFH